MMKKIEKFKTSFIIALSFVLLLSVVGWVSYSDSGYPLETKEERVHWYSVEEGFKRAQSEGKYVIMDVYTDWCGWCKKMDADTYNNETVAEYLNEHFVLIKINAESPKEVVFSGETYTEQILAQGLGVSSFPMTIFFESESQPIVKLPGYHPPDNFLPIIRYIGEDWYKKLKFQEYLEKMEQES